MPAKSLKIDSLDLDLENPRIKLAQDQREAMQNILDEQKVKLINLAESIAVKGFSPIDRCLVMRSPTRSGHFIVLEGNRRVLAAKLLKKPALVDDLEMSDSFKSVCTRQQRILIPPWSSRLIASKSKAGPMALGGSVSVTAARMMAEELSAGLVLQWRASRGEMQHFRRSISLGRTVI